MLSTAEFTVLQVLENMVRDFQPTGNEDDDKIVVGYLHGELGTLQKKKEQEGG